MTESEFFNRYTYNPETDLLGSGGFGSVYKAFDNQERRYVAIKISQVKDIFGKFTLLNEVELSKNIDDHPNVARYEFTLRAMHPFPTDYAVMPYYEDGNLDMLLRENQGILQRYEYYQIVKGLLEGIAHLHKENVIHRDLKLANILMSKTKQGQWRPKIADFGLSRETENGQTSVFNSAIGTTVAYAAPEQIEDRSIRKNVDLWAIGVIMYRLITAEMPFDAPEGMDSANASQVISQKIVNLDIPEKLNYVIEPYQQIIRACWVKSPTERVQSADQLLQILNQKPPSEFAIGLPRQKTSPDNVLEHAVLVDKKSPIPSKAFYRKKPIKRTGETSILKPIFPDNPSIIKATFKGVSIGIGTFLVFGLWIYFVGTTPVPPSTIEPNAAEEAQFRAAQLSGTLMAYNEYLKNFPNGANSPKANDSIQKLTVRFKNLLNDADIFIDTKEYQIAEKYLQKASLICPKDEAVEKRFVLIKNN